MILTNTKIKILKPITQTIDDFDRVDKFDNQLIVNNHIL